MTPHEMMLAKRALRKIAHPPTPPERLPTGVYEKGRGFTAGLRTPEGKWAMRYFKTAEEAAKAREDSLRTL